MTTTTMDTSGFYKLDTTLLYGPNFVLNTNYELRCETRDQHTYPVDGWYWFNSEEEANLFFATEREPQRARDSQGRFIEDDPTTPDIDEAWA